MSDDDQVRFRVRVSGVRGSLKNFMQSADEFTKRVLEDENLWEEAAAMADDLRRQIKTRE
jgi:hypothetical protein